MKHFFRKLHSVFTPQRKREATHDQYGRSHAGVVECPQCHNVHFKKRWHASLSALPEYKAGEAITMSAHETCPACTMIKTHRFEGEIFIEGFPEHLSAEMLNMIRNFGETATGQDPQDRIIATEKTPRGYRVTTTENQLADRLAKKIKDAFNTVDLHFAHAAEPHEVVRIHVTFTGAK